MTDKHNINVGYKKDKHRFSYGGTPTDSQSFSSNESSDGNDSNYSESDDEDDMKQNEYLEARMVYNTKEADNETDDDFDKDNDIDDYTENKQNKETETEDDYENNKIKGKEYMNGNDIDEEQDDDTNVKKVQENKNKNKESESEKQEENEKEKEKEVNKKGTEKELENEEEEKEEKDEDKAEKENKEKENEEKEKEEKEKEEKERLNVANVNIIDKTSTSIATTTYNNNEGHTTPKKYTTSPSENIYSANSKEKIRKQKAADRTHTDRLAKQDHESERTKQKEDIKEKKDKVEYWKEYNKHGPVPSEWSLNHPPAERNEFWMLPPQVIFEALVHFVHTNQKITIPYGWEPVNYYQKNGTGIRGANIDEERPTMEDVLLKLTTVIHSKYNHRQNEIDDPNNLKSTVHYTPSIVSKNESIARNEEQSCTKTKNIKSLEVSMKKDVNKGEKMQLKIRHMIKILKQSI